MVQLVTECTVNSTYNDLPVRVWAAAIAYRVDEVAGDMTHQDAGRQQGVLEGQSIDLQWHVVDVNEVDA